MHLLDLLHLTCTPPAPHLHPTCTSPAPHLHPTCTSPTPLMHPSQLAHDEGAAAGEVHAIVAEGRGGEEAIKSGADLLARAQALHG